MQSISRNLPIAVIGIQQLLMLVCVALYLMVLSLPAFVLTAVFATASIFVHLSRMQPVTTALRQAAAEIGRASCREKSVSVRVDLGGRRIIKKKIKIHTKHKRSG